MNAVMNFENLKYLVDQIIGQLSEVTDPQYIKDSLEGRAIAKEKWPTDRGYCFGTPDYKSKYPPPQGLHFNIREVISFREKEAILFFQLIISTNEGEEKARLNIRWASLKSGYGLSRGYIKRLRKYFYQWKEYFYNKRDNEDKNSDHSEISLVVCREVDNLIIVGSEPRKEFDEICLQAGIYLLRHGILEKQAQGELYRLFEEVIKKFPIYKKVEKLELDTIKVFEKIVDIFKVPFNANSFKIYLKLHIHGLVRKEPALIKVTDPDDPDDPDSTSTSSYPDLEGHHRLIKGNDRWGIPEQTLYTLIRRGKVHAKKKFGRYVYDNDLYEQVWSLRKEKKKWEYLTNLLAEKRNIPKKSAQTSIQRWRKKGLSLEEIEERVEMTKPRKYLISRYKSDNRL